MEPAVFVVTKQKARPHLVPGTPFFPWMHQQSRNQDQPWHQVSQQQFDGCELAIREQYTL